MYKVRILSGCRKKDCEKVKQDEESERFFFEAHRIEGSSLLFKRFIFHFLNSFKPLAKMLQEIDVSYALRRLESKTT